MGLLLAQLAMAIWLIDKLHFRLVEFLMHFGGIMLPAGWFRWLTFIASIVIHVLALVAVFELTRRATSRIAFAAGAIIFNVLLHQLLFLALATVNAVSIATAGEKLVVGNPLVSRLPQWSVEWIWLLMIMGGYAIICDVNARCAKQVFTPAQLRMLLFTALAGWMFWTINHWCVYKNLEYLIPYEGDLSAYIWKSTIYDLVVFAPSAVFCIAAIVDAARAKKRLRDLAQGLCAKCGYNLRGTTSGTCPECGST